MRRLRLPRRRLLARISMAANESAVLSCGAVQESLQMQGRKLMDCTLALADA